MTPHVLGVGAVAAPGIGVPRLERAIAEGWSPAPLPRAGPWERLGAVEGAEPAALLGMRGTRTLSPASRLALIAAAEALGHPGPLPGAPETHGVVVGTRWGSIEPLVNFNRTALTSGPRLVNPSLFPNVVVNAHAGYLGILLGLSGPNVTVCGASAGLEAIGMAMDLLELGRADHLLAGGAESLGETLLRGQAAVGDPADGFPGEGAGFLLLGSHANGPPHLARLGGWAAETAHHPQHAPDARAAALADALSRAGLEPSAIRSAWFVGEPPEGLAVESHPLQAVIGRCQAAEGALAAVVASRSAARGEGPAVAASFPREGVQVVVVILPPG